MTHHPFGPSVFARRRACPASYMMEKDIPDTSSEPAEEGTAAHEFASFMLDGGHPSAREFIGKMTFNGYEVDGPMAHHTQGYVDRVRADVAKGGIPFIESQVSFSNWIPDGYGTTDAGVIFPELHYAVIKDLKYGQGVKVFAKDNDQAMLYGLGFMQDYGFLFKLDKFKLVIDQPRINHYDEHEVSRDELLAFGDVAAKVYEEATGPNPSFGPGESQCRFCKVNATCEARISWLAGSVGVLFDYDSGEIDTPGVPDGDIWAGPGVLTHEQLGRIHPHLDDLSNWIKAVKNYIKREHMEGHGIPHTKLVMGGRRSRFWKSKEDAEKALKAMRLKQTEMYKRTLISPAQAEVLVTPKQKERLKELVGWTEGTPTVVSADDPREPIGNTAEGFDYDD